SRQSGSGYACTSSPRERIGIRDRAKHSRGRLTTGPIVPLAGYEPQRRTSGGGRLEWPGSTIPGISEGAIPWTGVADLFGKIVVYPEIGKPLPPVAVSGGNEALGRVHETDADIDLAG